MPANLTPDYREAEEQYRQAATSDDKLAALRRMLTTIPKHKGTEKLQADIKRRIARLNDEILHHSRRKGFSIRVEREGAGQVVLVGPPNAGKSQLAATLSGVDLEVAPYPYSTHTPVPAMMPYRDIRIQLVDLPPVSAAHTESWVLNIVRTSDAALLVCDLSSPDVLDRTADCLTTLEAHKVRLVRGDRDPDPRARILEKRTRMVATKLDLPGSADRGPLIDEVYGERFEIDAVSAVEGRSTEGLAQRIFDLLRIVRVYSKPPGKEPDRSRPFVLPKGGTLLDFARIVHHDFAERLKFARLWGHGKFDGQRVTKDYVLEDGDVIELHA